MRLCLRLVVPCLLSIAIASSAHTQTIQHDIPYITDSAGTQKGDLYQPAGAGPFPAILYVHGGSWRSGSKKDFARLATDLAAKGYAGFSIDYDLRAHSYPTPIAESEAAVRFLRDHAAEYHIDPDRILIAGASAGGEIAALVALDPKNHIAAGIMLNAVFDLGTGSYYVIRRYLGGPCGQIGTTCADASPMSHIHADAPPFFVGHGTSDHLVPFASAELFTADMKKAGNNVTFYAAKNAGHMYFTKKDFYGPNLSAVEAFLAQTFSPR